jgi:hypothetical protein
VEEDIPGAGSAGCNAIGTAAPGTVINVAGVQHPP